MPPGRLFVLSGPSGVGKSTVLARIRARYPELWYSVSATTRRPRPGEVPGVNYHFVTVEEFQALIAAGQLLEHAVFAGNHYGTPAQPVRDQLDAGRDVLLEIEVQGARQVRAVPGLGDRARLVFLAPPSFEVLAARLTGRGTEDPSTVEARLAAARAELAAEPEFDHVVVNTDVEQAVESLIRLVAGSRR
ncbi:guanylate kinase [Nakamurella sp. YIM 132084]|uniref:Guanylate kinase n=1 Tax=Nakamurella leprariae TaxID=2803911 RepID=A0A939BWN7_9ACTN|nr:guanylate kinase [Nakamurella leprariae]